MLVDTHCHLDYDYAPATVDEVIAAARADGIGRFVTIGVDLGSAERLPRLAERFDDVWFTLGVHPHDAQSLEDAEAAAGGGGGDPLDAFRALRSHPKLAAIGEIGLDYHYEHSPKPAQRKWVKRQLDLALELGLPVVIHSREGEADLLPELLAYAARVPAGRAPGIIHCFTGTAEFARACVAAGFCVSFSGILTFKNSEALRAVARELPLDRVLVETDSPYLAPVPFRGKKCEPRMVKQTALVLAELKGVSFEELARVTGENAARVFGWG